MKNKNLNVAVLLFVVSFLLLACQKTQNQTVKTDSNQQRAQTVSANEISQLKNDVMVQFPAILKKGSKANCIEIFNEDNYKKYNADSKWAVSSRFASDSRSSSFEEGKKVLVTGKMTIVRDVSDTSKTCGIVTGQLFEIMEIQDL